MSTVQEQLRFLTHGAGVYATTDRVLYVRGDDARSWLNGQVTNDVRNVKRDTAVYALAATAKGRVVTDLWALEADGGVALVLPTACFDAALSSFDKHVIMEDVEFEQDEHLRVVTIQGPRAQDVAAKVEAIHAYRAPRLPGTGMDLWVRAEQVETTIAVAAEAARALAGGRVDEGGWTHAHVALGIPRVAIDFGDNTYPQEAGLKSRAVSFNKGCYIGQEVICMLETRGQLARRLVTLELAPGSAVSAGDSVQASGKRVGEVTSVSGTPEGGAPTLALAYLKSAFAEPGTEVSLGDARARVRGVVGLSDQPIVAP